MGSLRHNGYDGHDDAPGYCHRSRLQAVIRYGPEFSANRAAWQLDWR